jgi:CubicO group peptidase (beta-lactamase class C family)
MEIHGLCGDRFARVREEFERNFTERADVGGSFAATIDGEFVIDIWAGHRDEAKREPWVEDTIVNVWSSTKPMYFLAALMLADRGELDLHAPVTDYWPEYGQNGKEKTEVRHFLSHSAGLPGFGEALTLNQLYDWDHVVTVLARQEPWWEPGTFAMYHAITQGYLVGEVVRRVTGKSMGTFFTDEIAGPLGADFHIGVASDAIPRVAEMLPFSPPPADAPAPPARPDFLKDRVDGTPDPMPPVTNSEGWRRAEIPAANGHGNARSIARVGSAVANGGSVDGVTLLSESGRDRLFEHQIDMGEMPLGMGYGLSPTVIGAPQGSRVCWWGGAGGSTHIIDVGRRASFSYVMNQMNYDQLGADTVGSRGGKLTEAFYASLSTRV